MSGWRDEAHTIAKHANRIVFDTDQDRLASLDDLTAIATAAAVAQSSLVDELRRDGVKWDAIAAAMGMTKQACHWRYGRTRPSGAHCGHDSCHQRRSCLYEDPAQMTIDD